MPSDTESCRQQSAAGLIVRVGVVGFAGHDVVAVKQARRDGDMGWRAGRFKLGIRLCAAEARQTGFVHRSKFRTMGADCKWRAATAVVTVGDCQR